MAFMDVLTHPGIPRRRTAGNLPREIEAMNMIRKGQLKQLKGVKQGDSVSGVKFIEAIFGIAA